MNELPIEIISVISDFVCIIPWINQMFNRKDVIHNGIISKCLLNRKLIENVTIKKLVGDDEEFMLKAVKRDGDLLGLGSINIRNNFKIVLEAVSNRGRSLWYADNKLKSDITIIKKATYNDITAFAHTNEDVRKDIKIIRILIIPKYRINNRLLTYCSNKFTYHNKIIEDIEYLLENGVSLGHMQSLCPNEINLFDNYKIMLESIKREGYNAYRVLPKDIINNHRELLTECRKYHYNLLTECRKYNYKTIT